MSRTIIRLLFAFCLLTANLPVSTAGAASVPVTDFRVIEDGLFFPIEGPDLTGAAGLGPWASLDRFADSIDPGRSFSFRRRPDRARPHRNVAARVYGRQRAGRVQSQPAGGRARNNVQLHLAAE